MPIYEYVCQACGHRAEVIQKVDDPAPAACPACGKGPMARQVSRTSFQLKGGGWYADLYGSSPAKPVEGAATAKEGGEAAKSPPAGTPAANGGGAKDTGGKDAGASSAPSPAAGSGGATSAPKSGGGSGSDA